MRWSQISNALSIITFMVGASLAVALTVSACAGWGEKSCKVVDLAHHACTVVRYFGDDGQEHELRLSPDEAQEFARGYAAKLSTAQDAGSDAP